MRFLNNLRKEDDEDNADEGNYDDEDDEDDDEEVDDQPSTLKWSRLGGMHPTYPAKHRE